MLTVGSLTADCGLKLAAGESRADEPIRWVHISELADPTPWLSGGELLLTTGIQLPDADSQERLVDLLAEGGAAGLGFGTGFDHSGLPEALTEAARRRGLPLFEVPYEMPFIAITERAFRRLVNEQYDVLERGTRVHERLERLVIEGHGLQEVTSHLAGAIGGSAVVLDGLGAEVARHPARGGPGAAVVKAVAAEISELLEEAPVASFNPAEPTLAERALAVPVPGRRGAEPVGWLLAVADGDSLGDFERLIARQAALVVGMELMRERIVRETERRLAGDLLSDALSGRLDAEELQGRLRPFGIGSTAAVAVYDVSDPAGAEGPLEATLAAEGVPALVADDDRRGEAVADRDPRRRRSRPVADRPQGTFRPARPRPQRARGGQPLDGSRRPAARLPRGALRARGDVARERLGPGGRITS